MTIVGGLGNSKPKTEASPLPRQTIDRYRDKTEGSVGSILDQRRNTLYNPRTMIDDPLNFEDLYLNDNNNTKQVQIEETKDGLFPEMARSRYEHADHQLEMSSNSSGRDSDDSINSDEVRKNLGVKKK